MGLAVCKGKKSCIYRDSCYDKHEIILGYPDYKTNKMILCTRSWSEKDKYTKQGDFRGIYPVEETISHEILHFVLHRIDGTFASLGIDRLSKICHEYNHTGLEPPVFV